MFHQSEVFETRAEFFDWVRGGESIMQIDWTNLSVNSAQELYKKKTKLFNSSQKLHEAGIGGFSVTGFFFFFFFFPDIFFLENIKSIEMNMKWKIDITQTNQEGQNIASKGVLSQFFDNPPNAVDVDAAEKEFYRNLPDRSSKLFFILIIIITIFVF